MTSSTTVPSPLHLPALGQELAPSGYPSSENEPIRREPFPINPRYLVACFVLFGFRLIPFLAIRLFLLTPIGDSVTARIRVCILVPTKGRSCGRLEFPYPGDASGDLYGSFDSVFDTAGGLVDEGRPERGVLGES